MCWDWRSFFPAPVILQFTGYGEVSHGSDLLQFLPPPSRLILCCPWGHTGIGHIVYCTDAFTPDPLKMCTQSHCQPQLVSRLVGQPAAYLLHHLHTQANWAIALNASESRRSRLTTEFCAEGNLLWELSHTLALVSMLFRTSPLTESQMMGLAPYRDPFLILDMVWEVYICNSM